MFISNRDLLTRYVLEPSGNLEIFDFSRGDDGCYRCLVANAFGNDSRDFELTMRKTLTVEKKKEEKRKLV